MHRFYALMLALLFMAVAAPRTAGAHDEHHHHHGAAATTASESDDLDAEASAPPGGSVYWLDGTWMTDAGAPVRLRDFEGKPVVLTLLYTSCKQVCPILVEDVKRIQQAVTENERAATAFVVVTIDPERDTPAALAAFKKKTPAAKAWTFLNGSPDQVLELASVLGVRYRKAGAEFVHSNKITVLDAKGEIAHQAVGLRAPVADTIKAIRKVLDLQ